MKWFREHTRLTVICAVILALVIVIVVSFVHFGSSSLIGQKVQSILGKVQEPVSDTGNGVANGLRGLLQFKDLVRQNEELKQTVSEQNEEIIRLRQTDAELAELQALSAALNYEGVQTASIRVTADVTAMDGSNWFNIFTINAGENKGVMKNATVLNGDGLVGRVLEVGDDWSKVIAIIDENNSVSFRAFRDGTLMGILSGDGKGGLTGYMLDEDAAIIEGDVLITSGLGVNGKGIYPANIPIGKVSKVNYDNDSLLKTVEIEPNVAFKKLQKVMVVVTN